MCFMSQRKADSILIIIFLIFVFVFGHGIWRMYTLAGILIFYLGYLAGVHDTRGVDYDKKDDDGDDDF